jgi:hypothetical protein
MLARKSRVGIQNRFPFRPKQFGVEKVEKTGMTQQRPAKRKIGEANDCLPITLFQAIGHTKGHRR